MSGIRGRDGLVHPAPASRPSEGAVLVFLITVAVALVAVALILAAVIAWPAR